MLNSNILYETIFLEFKWNDPVAIKNILCSEMLYKWTCLKQSFIKKDNCSWLVLGHDKLLPLRKPTMTLV